MLAVSTLTTKCCGPVEACHNSQTSRICLLLVYCSGFISGFQLAQLVKFLIVE